MGDDVGTCLGIVNKEVSERTERFWTTLLLKLPKSSIQG